MSDTEIILALLFVMVILVALARRVRMPYPILLVLAGLGISFIPGLPRIELDPNLVFILFLPPILQFSAYNTPIRDFRANIRSIGMLSIGLVLATTTVVAVVAHFVLMLDWPVAFVLGAIVAPPDAVAASSIAQRLRLPRRIVTILEGESLVNDATALVVYRVAIAAVATGTFSIVDAGSQFLLASAGGVAIGLIVGLVLTPFFRRLVEDVPVYLVLTFLSGYGAYLLAEALHASGVVAVVALGLFYAQPRFNTMTPELRLQGSAVWEIVVFLLNGLIFILIGLQLPRVVHGLSQPPATLLWYAAAICLTVILFRIAWVFPGAYVPRMLFEHIRKREPFPPQREVTIVAWTGMRGIVTLASALALPAVNGTLFPDRDLIIFLSFSVILVTLVLQGLSLPVLIRWLKVVDDGSAEREEHKARLKAAMAGQARLEQLYKENQVTDALVQKLGRQYEGRIRRYSGRYHGEPDGAEEDHYSTYERVEQDLIEAELAAIIQLRNEEIINDEILRRVQRDLDLQLLRLRQNGSN